MGPTAERCCSSRPTPNCSLSTAARFVVGLAWRYTEGRRYIGMSHNVCDCSHVDFPDVPGLVPKAWRSLCGVIPSSCSPAILSRRRNNLMNEVTVVRFPVLPTNRGSLVPPRPSRWALSRSRSFAHSGTTLSLFPSPDQHLVEPGAESSAFSPRTFPPTQAAHEHKADESFLTRSFEPQPRSPHIPDQWALAAYAARAWAVFSPMVRFDCTAPISQKEVEQDRKAWILRPTEAGARGRVFPEEGV